ncbi:hypothetical protein LMG28138_02952 [Pararobbsia alpina]|uniref:YaiO beta-barrel domain-containing protein n=1 Tax=Pararobbsia alpina TaxID=621374 RepID=A0A6S7CHN8_9BURK|nr:hypothetical protein LMG28138_02952 [Pararobbsia alpina]
MHRFGERTTFGSIDYIKDLDADWFGAARFAGTTQGTILPSARVDLSINRKVLLDRSLVFSLGAGYAWNRSGHRTQLYHAGLIWYVVPQWILEAGWNYSVDSPGSIKAPAYLTWSIHPLAMAYWMAVLSRSIEYMDPALKLEVIDYHGDWVHTSLLSANIAPHEPDPVLLALTSCVCIVGGFARKERWLPFAYLLRIACATHWNVLEETLYLAFEDRMVNPLEPVQCCPS